MSSYHQNDQDNDRRNYDGRNQQNNQFKNSGGWNHNGRGNYNRGGGSESRDGSGYRQNYRDNQYRNYEQDDRYRDNDRRGNDFNYRRDNYQRESRDNFNDRQDRNYENVRNRQSNYGGNYRNNRRNDYQDEQNYGYENQKRQRFDGPSRNDYNRRNDWDSNRDGNSWNNQGFSHSNRGGRGNFDGSRRGGGQNRQGWNNRGQQDYYNSQRSDSRQSNGSDRYDDRRNSGFGGRENYQQRDRNEFQSSSVDRETGRFFREENRQDFTNNTRTRNEPGKYYENRRFSFDEQENRQGMSPHEIEEEPSVEIPISTSPEHDEFQGSPEAPRAESSSAYHSDTSETRETSKPINCNTGYPYGLSRASSTASSLHSPASLDQVTARVNVLTMSSTVVAPKKAPAIREGKEKVTLLTNLYPIEVSSKIVYRYDVDIKIVAEGNKTLSLMKSGNKIDRHRLCLEALRIGLNAYRLLREGEAAIHDGASVLVTSENIAATLKPYNGCITVNIGELSEETRKLIEFKNARSVDISIQPCSSSAHEMDISKFHDAQTNPDMAQIDSSWKNFYEMLTNYDALTQGNFNLYGGGKLFADDARRENYNCGQELIKGGDKSIKFIRGSNPQSKTIAALVLDEKTGIFFKENDLIVTLEEFLASQNEPELRGAFKNRCFPFENKALFNRVNNYIKGLRLFKCDSNGEKSSFVAAGITDYPAVKVELPAIKKGQKTKLIDFYGQTSNIRLAHWLPAIILKGKKLETFFPFEILRVAPHQRVPLSKTGGKPPRATKPNDRVRSISQLLRALNLDEGGIHNEFLKAFGVRIAVTPISVEGIRRQPAQVSIGQGKKLEVDKNTAGWKVGMNDIFARPGKADKILILYTCKEETAKNALIKLSMAAKQRGMTVKTWEKKFIEKGIWPLLKTAIKQAKEERCTLVMFIDSFKNKSHGALKLAERLNQLTTQQITSEIAEKLHQSQTCYNVICKLNCKLTGLNYSILPEAFSQNVWIKKGNTLIFGYDVAHPPPPRPGLPSEIPSVVGFSFNGAPDPEQFIGDFQYQQPRMEQIDDRVLMDRFKWIVEKFAKNRGKLPENVFIIRDGVSEGQYQMVLNNEMQAIEVAVEEYNEANKLKWDPKFVLVIVTKRHNNRLFKKTDREIQNPQPLTVVDTDIVKPNVTHFFIQSHRPLIGTAKSGSYTVMRDDLDLSMDSIQSLLIALTFTHQISSSPICIPEPVYQADEWAKRGSEMFQCFDIHYKVPLCDTKMGFLKKPRDFEEMTRMLSYKDTKMVDGRINA